MALGDGDALLVVVRVDDVPPHAADVLRALREDVALDGVAERRLGAVEGVAQRRVVLAGDAGGAAPHAVEEAGRVEDHVVLDGRTA